MKMKEWLPLKVYPFTLSRLDTSPCFLATFTDGNSFCDFLYGNLAKMELLIRKDQFAAPLLY